MQHCDLAHPSSVCFLMKFEPPPPLLTPLSVSTNSASRFPQCLANITTKMVDAMEEYEKEAGCVPILHPEVKPFILLYVRKHANIHKICRTSLHVCNSANWLMVYVNSDAPCKTTGVCAGGGSQVANDAKVANASPLLDGQPTMLTTILNKAVTLS